MEFQQLFTRLIHTVHAVFSTSGESALPDCTDAAKPDKPLAVALAAVAIDIFGL